jgi:hypothetical protein
MYNLTLIGHLGQAPETKNLQKGQPKSLTALRSDDK